MPTPKSPEHKKNVIIIGAGASGLIAAVFAARAGHQVTILEASDKPAKKLLRTGSGRCNMTNIGVSFSEAEIRDETLKDAFGNPMKPLISRYHGMDPAFAGTVISGFPLKDTLSFFESLGLKTRAFDGWYYPYNEEAASVKDALIRELTGYKVKLKTNVPVHKVAKEEDGSFRVETDGWCYHSDALILACGSKASLLKNAPDGYAFAASFGHTILPPFPALVSLHTGNKKAASVWSGTRARAKLTILADGEPISSEIGQIQFTAKGISGIAVMNQSAGAIKALNEGHSVSASLNFIHDLDAKGGGLSYILPHRLSPLVIGKETDEKNMAARLSDYRIPISGYGELAEAQAASGGVLTSEINPETMESRLCPGLFITGEMLDIVGECGGYNLQFAWSSGALAGSNLTSRLASCQTIV